MARDLAALIEQKKAQLQQLEARAAKDRRKLDRNRKIIVGAVVLKEMESSVEFRTRLGALLSEKVTKPADREKLQPWLQV